MKIQQVNNQQSFGSAVSIAENVKDIGENAFGTLMSTVPKLLKLEDDTFELKFSKDILSGEVSDMLVVQAHKKILFGEEVPATPNLLVGGSSVIFNPSSQEHLLSSVSLAINSAKAKYETEGKKLYDSVTAIFQKK